MPEFADSQSRSERCDLSSIFAHIPNVGENRTQIAYRQWQVCVRSIANCGHLSVGGLESECFPLLGGRWAAVVAAPPSCHSRSEGEERGCAASFVFARAPISPGRLGSGRRISMPAATIQTPRTSSKQQPRARSNTPDAFVKHLRTQEKHHEKALWLLRI